MNLDPAHYTTGERVVLWCTAHLPKWLLEQPERVVINVACVVIGVSALLPPPENNVLFHWPVLGRVLWATVMIVGSVIALIGTLRHNRDADRIGALMVFGASLFISFILFGTVGLRALLTGVIFAGVAAAKLLRFLRATAVRIRIRHHLMELKEQQENE